MILIIKTNKKLLHNNEFVKPIEDIANNLLLKTKVIKTKEINKTNLAKAEKIIISGTSLKDNDFLKDLESFSWIKNYNKPILGICAGAQIIGLIYNGKIKKKTEIGMTKVNFKKSFLGISGEKEVYELHNNYVEFSNDFEVFAKNEISQAAKHKDKGIYAVLFHPEVKNKEMIEEFLKRN